MSKIGKLIKSVTKVLGLSPKAPQLLIPEAEIPTPPAPNAITDTGQTVAIGDMGDVKNQRVSGRSTVRRSATSNPILGGLGQNGLNI